jgi:acyl-coenzyme A thioesterase PaaI-like protein
VPRRVPNLREWIAASEQRALLKVLGVHGRGVGEGWAEYTVEPSAASTDGRGSVSSFAATIAADMGVLVAATTTIDTDIEENNGTAELSMTHVQQPAGPLLVRCEVASEAPYMRVVLITVRDERGVTTAHGRGTFAVRPKPAPAS